MDARLLVCEQYALTDAETFHRLPTGMAKYRPAEFQSTCQANLGQTQQLSQRHCTLVSMPRPGHEATSRPAGRFESATFHSIRRPRSMKAALECRSTVTLTIGTHQKSRRVSIRAFRRTNVQTLSADYVPVISVAIGTRNWLAIGVYRSISCAAVVKDRRSAYRTGKSRLSVRRLFFHQPPTG